MRAVTSLNLFETPLVIVDLETTGLTPGMDRVIEITVLRIDPHCEPELVLDTLVNPCRKIAGTEIHGIRDRDVRAAPRFEEIAHDVWSACSGAVFIAYNVYFDLRFLAFEFERSGLKFVPPHLCAMYMRPLMGLGKKCPLSMACESAGIDVVRGHWAAADAIATTELVQSYQDHWRMRGLRTFGDLRTGRKYKFLESLERILPERTVTTSEGPRLSRAFGNEVPDPSGAWAVREYQELLSVLLSDGGVTRDEIESALHCRARLGLTDGQVRAVHARLFAAAINPCISDEFVDDDEVRLLADLAEALQLLGWAPGR